MNAGNNRDESVARLIHDQLNCTGITENAVFPKERERGSYRPRTLVDDSLEYIDPNPNIYTLFVQFNKKFFWNVLLPVQVKWSPRMTSCAGICSFHPRNKECIISLSSPLLKLRPRKDLIETLLHEMIHAYLFLTNDNRDRDGHGPVFKSHMRRINLAAGTNITVYHTFHEEVRSYQQHWWRCNGPCQSRAPFFGTVRRSMNRAPGPNDFWWKEHQRTCRGQFIKIKEPEKVEKKKKSKAAPKTADNNNLLNWIKKIDKSNGKMMEKAVVAKGANPQKITDLKSMKNNYNSNVQGDVRKLGNDTNNVHGWGTGGPQSNNDDDDCHCPSTSTKNTRAGSSKTSNSRISFSVVLGGSGSGRSILLDRFPNKETNDNSKNKCNQANSLQMPVRNKSLKQSEQLVENDVEITVTCPNCNKLIGETKINHHLDICLDDTKNRVRDCPSTIHNDGTKDANKPSGIEIQCPLCPTMVDTYNFNAHLSTCFKNDADERALDVSTHDYSTSNSIIGIIEESKDDGSLRGRDSEASSPDISTVGNNSSIPSGKTKPRTSTVTEVTCPSCNKYCNETEINDHLDSCLGSLGNTKDVGTMSSGTKRKRRSDSGYRSNKSNDNCVYEVIDDDESTRRSKALNPYKSTDRCLICDKSLEASMSLNDHLEECVASIFNNSSDHWDDTIEERQSNEDHVPEGKSFPCPVCMMPVDETKMNDHLDLCLNKNIE